MSTTYTSATGTVDVDPFDCALVALRTAGLAFEVVAEFDVRTDEGGQFERAA